MTSEDKVKRVYPKAIISYYGSIFTFGVTRVVYAAQNGAELGRASTRRASWAWADAWRRIQRTKRGRKDGRG